jgi:hypothetical protein
LISSIPFTVMGRAFSKEQAPEAQYRTVSPTYLKVKRIPSLLLEAARHHTRETWFPKYGWLSESLT